MVMLVGVEDVTSRSVGASETGKYSDMIKILPRNTSKKKTWGDGKKTEKKLTGGLCASQRLTLLIPVDSIHMNQILCLWCQSGQSEEVPTWGQPLIFGPPSTRLLIANAIASDDRSWSQPVDSQGVGANVGEVQASRRIQSWKERYCRLREIKIFID